MYSNRKFLVHKYDVPLFVDGARFFNAAVSQGVSLSTMARDVDAVSISLNKGLGAPYGAMLCGSRDLIQRSRRNHRVLGSHSVHKEGIFAAAAIVALDTMYDRLDEDHERAKKLAKMLDDMPGLRVNMQTVQTNIVRVETCNIAPTEFVGRVMDKGIGVSVLDKSSVKFVIHYGISDEDINDVVAVVRMVLSEV